jgi:hypothetical protein
MFVKKWNRILNMETSFPKDIIKIIESYTLDPRKQFANKYVGMKIYRRYCECRGSSLHCISKFSVDRENQKCEKCFQIIRFIEQSYGHCKICCSDSNFISSRGVACFNCNEIDFCCFANSDTDVCVLDKKCVFCKYQVHGEFDDGKVICNDCGDLFVKNKKSLLKKVCKK